MAFNITFDVGTPCGGGSHAPVTIQRVENAAQNLTVTVGFTEARQPLTATEREQFALMLVRLLCSQGSAGTNAQVRTALEAKTVDLTLPGF